MTKEEMAAKRAMFQVMALLPMDNTLLLWRTQQQRQGQDVLFVAPYLVPCMPGRCH